MLRKILSLILSATLLITALSACSTLASTKEEVATVMTVGDYKVPYEIYYYITMNLRRDMPGATDKEIEDEAFEMLREMYAVFSVAEDFGIAFDDKYIASVANDAAKAAIDECGSKEEYKKALGENYMNDSVFRFLKRHSRTADELLSAISTSDKYPVGIRSRALESHPPEIVRPKKQREQWQLQAPFPHIFGCNKGHRSALPNAV